MRSNFFEIYNDLKSGELVCHKERFPLASEKLTSLTKAMEDAALGAGVFITNFGESTSADVEEVQKERYGKLSDEDRAMVSEFVYAADACESSGLAHAPSILKGLAIATMKPSDLTSKLIGMLIKAVKEGAISVEFLRQTFKRIAEGK